MIVESRQEVNLITRLPSEQALTFTQQPTKFLRRLDFLQEVSSAAGQVSGVLAVPFPLLGEVTLPFLSMLEPLPEGAALRPQPLATERAWLEIAGTARQESEALRYNFLFRAHLSTPNAEEWGTRAFEKMVLASAQRCVARVTSALPAALQAALEEAETQPPKY